MGKKIILASASPRRINLLRALGLDFEVAPSHEEDGLSPAASPLETVMQRAFHKAQTVARRYASGLVLGADTVVFFRGEVMGKPQDLSHARAMLKCLCGNTHTVFTGLCLWDVGSERHIEAVETTEVTLKNLSEPEIDLYLKTIEPLDKAGAYASEGPGVVLIKEVKGCWHNVMGLPLARLDEMLRAFGFSILQEAWAKKTGNR